MVVLSLEVLDRAVDTGGSAASIAHRVRVILGDWEISTRRVSAALRRYPDRFQHGWYQSGAYGYRWSRVKQ